MLNGIPWYVWMCIGSILGFVLSSRLTDTYGKAIERDNLRLQGLIHSLRQQILKYQDDQFSKTLTPKVKRLDPFGIHTQGDDPQ